MDPVDARIRARALAMDRLNVATTWTGVAALAAVAVFGVIAAATIPGKASSGESVSTPTASANVSTSNTTPYRHHRSESSNISASSGPPVAVTGGSR